LITTPAYSEKDILELIASLERYSKHPLSNAIIKAAERAAIKLLPVTHITELPGDGLKGNVADKQVQITSRKNYSDQDPLTAAELPPSSGGLECGNVAV